MAEWLNSAFSGVDAWAFNAVHGLAQNAGGFFTPLLKIVSLIGAKGIIFFVLGLALMLFAKTRKAGVCMIGALAIGAIVTSLILKNSVARVRPYLASEEYGAFWEFVKGENSKSYCFPSGHVTMATAAAVAFFIFFNKKWSFIGFIVAILMAVSRVYFIVHYFTDVIGGFIVGIIAGIIAYFITKFIYYIAEKYKDKKFFAFCLNSDIRNLFKNNRKNLAVESKEKTEKQEEKQ